MIKDIALDKEVEAISGLDIFWVDAMAMEGTQTPVKIRVGFVPPKLKRGKKAIGSVVLSPGRSEYIEKYAEVILELQTRGFAVLVVDQRGQGMSTRLGDDRFAGHMDNFDLAAQSLAKAIDAFKDKLPSPVTLLCHSMGGAIGLEMLLKNYAPCVERAVFSAPMWALFTMPGAKQIVGLMCYMGKTKSVAATSRRVWSPEPFEGNELTHDSRRYARANALMLAEPRLQIAGATNGWVKAAFETMEGFTPERLAEVQIPILILSAEADTIVNPASHFRIGGQLANGKVVSIPNSKHEIMMETDDIRAQFWHEFDEFVKS